MTGETIQQIELFSTIGANFITIIGGILSIIGVILTFNYFAGKKYKALIISSKTFQIPIENEDVIKAIFPRKIRDEPITFSYDKNLLSPKDFCNQKNSLLSEVKSKYNPICIFGISEMFIPFWIGYFLQDSIHIRGFRKLKEGVLKYSGNPRAWPSVFSLKWGLYLKGLMKSFKNRYEIQNFSYNQGEEINLIINISYKIEENSLPNNLSHNRTLIFGLNKTDTSFLVNESQVFKFSKEIKSVMHKLDQQIGNTGKINIFCSLPIPFCIKLGQAIHRNGPECILYDFNRDLNQHEAVISTKDITI